MDGPISDGRDVVIGEQHPVRHMVNLVEHHEIVEPLPAGRCSTAADVDAITARCHTAAVQWARHAGLEIRGSELFHNGNVYAGVRFDVTIGAGVAHDADSSSEGWAWSGRWQHWYDVLHRVARGYRQSVPITDGDPDIAQVIPLFGGRAVVGSEYGID